MHEFSEWIEVFNASEHNLKNIDIKIPRDQLVVFTGVSGSGKSSLAFDTIFAEGQRRYLETFSAYARQFMGGLERPKVEQITGLSPVISIEQKTVSKNPRSTVGTITEVYDFLRVLYARAADAYSKESGLLMVKYSDDQILDLILKNYADTKIAILAPVVKGRKGHYKELFVQLAKQGFVKVRVDGKIQDILPEMKLDRYKVHDIEVIVDRMKVADEQRERLKSSLKTAFKMGGKSLMVQNLENDALRHYSKSLMCPETGISYDDPAPNSFSFNSPYGACERCSGIGMVVEADASQIIPDFNKNLKQGAIAPLKEMKAASLQNLVQALLEYHGYSERTPFSDIDEDTLNKVLYGSEERFQYKSKAGNTFTMTSFPGVIQEVLRYTDKASSKYKRWHDLLTQQMVCPSCKGARLKEDALYFKFRDLNIADLSLMSLGALEEWMNELDQHLRPDQLLIAEELLKEIRHRLSFLNNVGLNYLSLNRTSGTLSGGEAQRIRLATQMGSALVGVLYILDEPSIGLHQRDNQKLIDSLKKIRDIGNSVLVVEHDRDMIEQADFLVDIGPKAGKFGGQIVSASGQEEFKNAQTTTAAYVRNEKKIEVPAKLRKGNGKTIKLIKASGNNLKDVTVSFPLGKFIVVSGVSGSGKSTLINQTLYPHLHNQINKTTLKYLPCEGVEGLEHIDKVIRVDQAPIGRTPRSNPATYVGFFGDIRNLYAQLPEAQIRGYKPGTFSFNVKGGRCEQCKGAGMESVEMNFLPDVEVLCSVCNGNRYSRETLEVRFKGKSITDVLNMSVEEAMVFFEAHPKIYRYIKALNDVGLGYLSLGQSSTTLSGGEAQRVKLASELAKKQSGKTMYIFDEPTTGLHFEDVDKLLEVLHHLVDLGNTVVVIEHNLDVIKVADHIIDMGPEGGIQGGQILSEGTPTKVANSKKSITGPFLKVELERS